MEKVRLRKDALETVRQQLELMQSHLNREVEPDREFLLLHVELLRLAVEDVPAGTAQLQRT